MIFQREIVYFRGKKSIEFRDLGLGFEIYLLVFLVFSCRVTHLASLNCPPGQKRILASLGFLLELHINVKIKYKL